jgi:hypothetical protein
MSWYRFAKQYINSLDEDTIFKIFQERNKNNFTNSEEIPESEENVNIDSNMENALNPERLNKVINPKMLNEVRQPIRTKANGQGQDALLNVNKDIPIYSDNFIHTTDWNTS